MNTLTIVLSIITVLFLALTVHWSLKTRSTLGIRMSASGIHRPWWATDFREGPAQHATSLQDIERAEIAFKALEALDKVFNDPNRAGWSLTTSERQARRIIDQARVDIDATMRTPAEEEPSEHDRITLT